MYVVRMEDVRKCKQSLLSGNLKGENHVVGCKDNNKMGLKQLFLEDVEADNGYISSTTGGELLDKPFASECELRHLNLSILENQSPNPRMCTKLSTQIIIIICAT